MDAAPEPAGGPPLRQTIPHVQHRLVAVGVALPQLLQLLLLGGPERLEAAGHALRGAAEKPALARQVGPARGQHLQLVVQLELGGQQPHFPLARVQRRDSPWCSGSWTLKERVHVVGALRDSEDLCGMQAQPPSPPPGSRASPGR